MELFIIILATFLLNIPAGYFRENFKRRSWQWWVAVHSTIPFIIILRVTLGINYYFIPLLILVAILGQFIGGRPVRRYIQVNLKKNRDS